VVLGFEHSPRSLLGRHCVHSGFLFCFVLLSLSFHLGSFCFKWLTLTLSFTPTQVVQTPSLPSFQHCYCSHKLSIFSKFPIQCCYHIECIAVTRTIKSKKIRSDHMGHVAQCLLSNLRPWILSTKLTKL
jgi:hypothetical protein